MLYDRFDQVPPEAWNEITGKDGALTMDLRLLGAFQRTLEDQCKCWAVLFRDDAGRAIGAAALSLFKVDGLDSTRPAVQKLSRAVRQIWPGCLYFNVLFCGLPVPSGESHLRIVDGVDGKIVLDELQVVMNCLARQERGMLCVLKEFNWSECGRLSFPEYIRGGIPALHVLKGRFTSLAEYLGALKARYRAQINRSIRKFKLAGFEAEHVCGPPIADLFTDEVHRLYLAVWERSQYRLEQLPVEFFREVARTLGDQVSLTVVRREGRIVGFTYGLAGRTVYYNMYSGIDYDLNKLGDLYFNLFYCDLDYAFKAGAAEIHLGQTSDDFKSRLGTSQLPLHFYVRGSNSFLHLGLRRFGRWAFPPVASVRKHDVFKESSSAKARLDDRRESVAARDARRRRKTCDG